jgi:hypothetical protein
MQENFNLNLWFDFCMIVWRVLLNFVTRNCSFTCENAFLHTYTSSAPPPPPPKKKVKDMIKTTFYVGNPVQECFDVLTWKDFCVNTVNNNEWLPGEIKMRNLIRVIW